MKQTLVVLATITAAAVAGAFAYQTAARDQQYRLLLARGEAALRQEQTYAALEAYSGAIALRPDSMLAHLRRAETYRLRGDLGTAAKDFKQAAALDPAATRPLEEWGDLLYQLERYPNAAAVYESRLRLDDRSGTITYKLALSRYRNREIDLALGAATQALRLNGGISEAHYLLGLCLREKGRVPEALDELRLAVAQAPTLFAAREELVDLYRSLGRHADELEQLQALGSFDRQRPERQVALASAYTRAARDARDLAAQDRLTNLAILTLTSALERAPDHPIVFSTLGEVWLDVARSRDDAVALRKALEMLRRAASSSSSGSDAFLAYGRALVLDNQLEASLSALREATERFPVNPAAFLDYAAVAEQTNQLAIAQKALMAHAALVAGAPDSAARAARIGLLSLRLEEPSTAILWLQRALASEPTNLDYVAALADAQLRNLQPDDARATAARGLALDPRNAHLLAFARKLRSS